MKDTVALISVSLSSKAIGDAEWMNLKSCKSSNFTAIKSLLITVIDFELLWVWAVNSKIINFSTFEKVLQNLSILFAQVCHLTNNCQNVRVAKNCSVA